MLRELKIIVMDNYFGNNLVLDNENRRGLYVEAAWPSG